MLNLESKCAKCAKLRFYKSLTPPLRNDVRKLSHSLLRYHDRRICHKIYDVTHFSSACARRDVNGGRKCKALNNYRIIKFGNGVRTYVTT